MPITPWGEMEALRAGRHSSGGGREQARRKQRNLLFAAMVVCCDRQGFEATSVADLLDESGLSRGTFYAHFDDKLDCFCAAETEIVRLTIELLQERLRGEGDEEARARAALAAFVEIVVAQPAAARLCLVDSYVAGPEGVAPIRDAIDRIVVLAKHALEEMPGGGEVPLELARAVVGGFYQVIYRRTQGRREEELPGLIPDLWEWAMSYRPLPGPLRTATRRTGSVTPSPAPPFAALNPEQRIIRAFAACLSEKGYPGTTIADVCAGASISQTTFYRHFADKQDLLEAALDSSGAQLLAASMPSARRALDWPAGVRAAFEASCGFLAAEPDFARLRMVDVYSAGPEAIAQRDATGMELLGDLLSPALAESEISPVIVEAVAGGIVGVFYDRIRAGETARLPQTAPLHSYLVLAPLLGAERAYEVATAKPTGPRTRPAADDA